MVLMMDEDKRREGDSFRAGVAQLVEHLLCKQGVAGSSPFASSGLRRARAGLGWSGAVWNSGGLPEWPKGADCKSAGLCLRWFESTTLHRGVSRETELENRSSQHGGYLRGSSSVGRASAFQAERRRFESGLPLRIATTNHNKGFGPGSSVVEHLLGKEEVVSSSLILGSPGN